MRLRQLAAGLLVDPGQTDSQSRTVYQVMFQELHGTNAFRSGNNHRRGNQPYFLD